MFFYCRYIYVVANVITLKSALYRVITQRVPVILCRRFGTTYRSHHQGARILFFGFLTLEEGTDWLSQNVGTELPLLAAS